MTPGAYGKEPPRTLAPEETDKIRELFDEEIYPPAHGRAPPALHKAQRVLRSVQETTKGFVVAMYLKSTASKNLAKGDSWREFTVEDAKRAIERELKEVLAAEAPEDIMAECADLGNRAMHLWDVAKRLREATLDT